MKITINEQKMQTAALYIIIGSAPFTEICYVLGITDLLPNHFLGILRVILVIGVYLGLVFFRKITSDIIVIMTFFIIASLIGFWRFNDTSTIEAVIFNSNFWFSVLPSIFFLRFYADPIWIVEKALPVSIFSICASTIYSIYGFQNSIEISSYMTYSYAQVIPWAFITIYPFVVNECSQFRKVFILVFSVASAAVIAIVGARGTILCFGCMLIYLTLFTEKSRGKKLGALALIVMCITIIYRYGNIIALYIYNFLRVRNIQSRTLRLLTDENESIFYDSGRRPLREMALKMIREHPIMGNGMTSEEQILGLGNYAHDVFLNLAVDFGIFVAIAFMFFYVYMAYYFFFSKYQIKQEWKYLFAAFYISGLPIMFLSGTPYTMTATFIAISIYFACRKENKTID